MTVRAAMQAVIDSVTAAAAGDAKGTALANGMVALAIADISANYPVTPNQQNKITALIAEYATNKALFTTALAA